VRRLPTVALTRYRSDSGMGSRRKLVSNEMESAKPLLKMKLKDVSPKYVEQWDAGTIMYPAAKITPTRLKILIKARQKTETRGVMHGIQLRERLHV
jgi:hypothetical protein